MDILDRIYWRVSSLEDFLKDLNGCPTLNSSKDKAGYIAFLQSTLVGIPSLHSSYQGPLDYKQYSDQTEVINRVMLRLQRQGKFGKNVLLNGFNSWRSEGGFAGIPSSINIPNNNSNQLRIPYWSKLLSRIGDELMMHILENLSIFTSAPPSCYIQLTGTPVSVLIATAPTNIPSPTKQGAMKEKSNLQKKSCQFEDADGGNKGDQNNPAVAGQFDKEGRIVHHKRKRDDDDDDVDGDNDRDVNITKARKTEKGTSQRMQSRPRKEATNNTKGTKDPKGVDSMVTGLDRSYYILNACYSRTVGRTWQKQDLIATLPASNRGAQKLTQHIFNSPKNGSEAHSKTDKIPSPDRNGKEDIDRQGEGKGKKKKKPQRTCLRLIKVQALLKTFLIQHRKLKFRSILNHHCPLTVPQENPIPDQTNTIHQECSKEKLAQRSQARETSPTLSSSVESVPHEKSFAELREESKLEGYSPKIFHRRRPKLCDLSNTQLLLAEQVNGKELVTSVDDQKEKVEKGAGDGTAKELNKRVRGVGREELRDRRGFRGTEEGMGDVGGNEVGEVEPEKSTDIELGVDEKQMADFECCVGFDKGIKEGKSLRIRKEMDINSTSSIVYDDAFLVPSRDTIPSPSDRQLSRKTNSKTEAGMQLPHDEVSADDADGSNDSICSQPDKRFREETNTRTKICTPLLSNDALRETFTDGIQSHPDGRIKHRTNSKTVMQLPRDVVTVTNEAKTDIIIDGMQTQPNRKLKKKTNTRSKTGMRLPSDAATLIEMKTEPWQVCLFLRQVLLKVVPDELWGSVHNRNVFFKGVKKFVQLGRFERLSLRELIEEIRVEDCDWCQLEKFKVREPPFTSLVKQHQLVTDFFHWLLIGYTIPLIMMCFYVTETSSSRNQLVFYRKPVWLLLEKSGIQYYVANGIMKPIKESDAGKLVASGLTLGFSRLRFVPKTKSLRPITRMGKSVIEEKKGLSVRLLLQDLFDVLTYHKIHQPSILGCSLLGIDGIYDKVLSFIQDRRGRNDTRPLYFVKIDIEKCYDSIKQSKLHQIISMLLQGHDKPDEYQIHRYIIVTKAASGGLQKISQRHVTTKLSLAGSFHRQLIQMAQCGDIKNAIIINQVHTVKVTPTALLQRLKQHVMADVVRSGRKYYWRQNGISQGSILSSLLCSFFYAHLERCYLSDIDQEGLMMRLIDDFILITPHLDKAQRFLHLLLSGVKQYGCSANPSKTLANFDFMFDDQLVPRSTELFPWCGVVFNTQTLNIGNDYTKYNNVSIRYTLTICTDKDTSLHKMRTKLTWSLKAKNVSIFMDPQINSFRTIVINVYHLLLLLAYRFHSYHHCLASCIKQNTPPLQFYSIWAFCVKAFHASVSKLRHNNDDADETTFPLTLNTVNWIGLKAFDTKLSKHRGLYHPLIKLVRKHRRKAASKMGKAMQEVLDKMTSPALPEDFMKMRR